ncbi:MAG: Gfo/Idh/MocA family oxidoreductase [Clostridia bacterium]|nr:Gfo/Idh/MocA family oxidoreductase [Clostridia bacterium]
MMKIYRRSFLKSSLALPLFAAAPTLGRAGETAPSERVRVGVIGLGGRARWMMSRSIPDAKGAEWTCGCDIYEPRRKKFMETYKGKNVYEDFRKMIEVEKLDGVFVETATHQRAWIGAMAMQAGAHIYLEKPMALTVEEGRYLVNAAKKYKKVTQVGTQQRSLPLCKWGCQQIADGVIGKIKRVQVPNFVGPIPYPKPDTLDPKDCPKWWDIWTNQSVLRPIVPEVQFSWSRWADYDDGGLCFGVSGWGTHSFDQAMMAMGTSLTGPTRILLEEPCTFQDSGKYPNRVPDDDETGASYYAMAKVAGPRARMKMYFGDIELDFCLDGDRGPGLGCIVTGENGKIEINRHKLASNPKSIVTEMPEEFRNTRDETVYHVENWLDCIRTGEKCAADVEIGHRSTTICHLVNIVRDTAPVGKEVHWDPEKELFTDLPEANAMLSRPRREGWELPTL